MTPYGVSMGGANAAPYPAVAGATVRFALFFSNIGYNPSQYFYQNGYRLKILKTLFLLDTSGFFQSCF